MDSATQVSLIQGLDAAGWHVASLNGQQIYSPSGSVAIQLLLTMKVKATAAITTAQQTALMTALSSLSSSEVSGYTLPLVQKQTVYDDINSAQVPGLLINIIPVAVVAAS